MKRIAAILILAAGVAACTPYWVKDRETRYAKCPQVQLLAPARGWIDPVGDNWQTRGQISEFAIECEPTKTSAEVKVTATIEMERRQNVTEEARVNFPLFMGVTRQDDIISKKIVMAPIKFAAGKNQVETQIEMPISLDFVKQNNPIAAPTPAPDDKDKKEKPQDTGTAADRIIVIGFQLTPQQLAYFDKLRAAPAAKFDTPNPAK